MNADLLLDNLGAIAATKGGIPKLRELILELAVRGMLVKTTDTKEMVSSKIPRRSTGPYVVPQSWVWVPLGKVIIHICSGGTPSKNHPDYWDGDIRWASVKDLKNGKYLDTTVDTITQQGLENSSSKLIPPGQAIVCVRMAIGKIVINKIPIAINQDLKAIRLSDLIDIDYFYYFYKTLRLKGTGMTVSGIKQKELLDIPVPLPPISEQHLIIERIEQLMSLCDDLESRQKSEREERRRLRTASLAALEDAATAEEAERAWAHVASEFGRLVDTVEDVAELRKSIFQLAIKGRLGTRSDNDEPASILLRHLIEQNPARREQQECAKKDDFSSLPDLPSGWVWTYVHCVGAVRLGRQRAPEHHYGPFMRPYLRVANVYEDRIDTSDILEMNFTPSEYETYRLEYGDVLLNEGQSRELVGRPAIYRDEVPGACFQNTLVRFRPFKSILSEYALIVFRAYLHSGRFQKKSQQTVNIAHLSAGRFSAMKFPLPPFAEQHRIVEKINQLMTQCDLLEAGIRARDATLEAFAGAACRALLDGPASVAAPAAADRATGQQRLPV